MKATTRERSSARAFRKSSRSLERLDRGTPLINRWAMGETWFIAVHKGGFGVATNVAKAILLAQESVAYDDKPSQLAIYRSDREMEPTGYITWPNGAEPHLCGLTNTHQGWVRRK